MIWLEKQGMERYEEGGREKKRKQKENKMETYFLAAVSFLSLILLLFFPPVRVFSLLKFCVEVTNIFFQNWFFFFAYTSLFPLLSFSSHLRPSRKCVNISNIVALVSPICRWIKTGKKKNRNYEKRNRDEKILNTNWNSDSGQGIRRDEN